MFFLRSLARAPRATAVETPLLLRCCDPGGRGWRRRRRPPAAPGGHGALGLAARAAPAAADDDDGARAGVEDGLVDCVRDQEEDRLEGY